MDFTNTKTIKIIAFILLALVVTQAVYTGIFVAKIDLPRKFLWGLEGVLFTMLAAFAGVALMQIKNYSLAWSAIAFSAVFNLIQVSVGLTMFGPFRAAMSQNEGLGVLFGSVLAFSFMIYYAAKLLLGLAALVIGLARKNEGDKVLGGITVAVGAIAMFSNAILIIFGRDGFLPSAVAGGSGVIATLLLAFCLLKLNSKD